MAKLSHMLKAILPAPLFAKLRTLKGAAQFELCRVTSRLRGPQRIFTDVYLNNKWGGEPGTFYSGSGSYESFVAQYAALVREFIEANKIDSIVDLGCGDFAVSQKIVTPGVRYVGVDIVEPLIARNNQLFGSSNVSFICLNIIKSDLPDGTLCIVRQVLQHLSITHIRTLLKALHKYRYIIITEHHPSDRDVRIYNKDIPTGFDTHLRWGSSVHLGQPPFDIKNIELFFEYQSGWTCDTLKDPTWIRSYLIRNN
jgi:SAM-dependent methyltransferase